MFRVKYSQFCCYTCLLLVQIGYNAMDEWVDAVLITQTFYMCVLAVA